MSKKRASKKKTANVVSKNNSEALEFDDTAESADISENSAADDDSVKTDDTPDDSADTSEDTSEDGADNAEDVSDDDTAENASGKKEKRSFKKKRKINTRSLKHGSLSVAFTVIFVAAVVLVNVLVTLVSDRAGISADLTGGGLYTLDETTENYLKNRLDADITVTVLNSEQTFKQSQNTRQVSEILERMKTRSGHINIEYLNLDQNPNYVSQFGRDETLDTDYIVVECEKTGRHRIITPTDYFGLDSEEAMYYYYYYGYVGEYLIEQEAVSAMMYTSNEDLVRIAFAEGFGESDSSALKDLLKKNGYSVETVDLLTAAEIDSDIDFVIVHAPRLDISSDCLAKLDRFLDNGGRYGKNVLYFAAVTQQKTPGIDSFLRDWSVSVGFYDIGQTDANYLISTLTPYAHRQRICSTSYTAAVYGSGLYTLGADIRPVFIEDNGLASVTALMKTYDNAFLYPLDNITGEGFDIDTAQRGEFNDVTVSVKYAPDGTPSRLFVIGSDTLSGSYLMAYSNANNSEFFVNLFDFVSGKEAGIVIKAKSPVNLTFEMNAKTANSLALVLCIIVPVCVIAAGIVVWLRRRHR